MSSWFSERPIYQPEDEEEDEFEERPFGKENHDEIDNSASEAVRAVSRHSTIDQEEHLEDPEEFEEVKRGKDGKPLSEIDLFVLAAKEQRAAQRRKERAAMAELELEKQVKEREIGSLDSENHQKFLLGLKMRSISMFCVALFGVVIMTQQLHVAWNGIELEENALGTGLKWVVTLSTILNEVMLYEYYSFRHKFEAKVRNFRPDALKFHKCPDFPLYLLEALVLALHTPPYISRTGIITDKFGMCMFLRAYLFLRVIRDMNPVWARTGEYKKHDVNKIYQFEFSPLYFFKFQFWNNPLSVMLFLTALVFLVSVYGFYITERERVPWVYDFSTSILFIMVTMTTVGYGENTPDDGVGRLFAMLAAISAMLLLAATSALLANFVELKYNESVGIGWSVRQATEQTHRNAAARLIQLSLRLYMQGKLRWSCRRQLSPEEAIAWSNALDRCKTLRIQIDESKVQGDGGYQIVSQRLDDAKEEVEKQMDLIDQKLDQSMDSIMQTLMYQLTKMEEMQGMVLDANFEAIRNNIVKVDKKVHALVKSRRYDNEM